MNNRHDCKGERPRQPVCCRTNAPAPPATSIPVDLRGPKNLTLECTHTCTHTPGITCGARLSGMSDFKGCFIFGSSVGFVALLCWQTRKQVANIKHYSGAVTHPNKHTHTCVRACSCALTHFSGDHFERQCSSGGEMLTEQRSAGGSPDSSAKVRETRRSGFIST